MIKILGLNIFLLFVFHQSLTQTPELDSLESVLKNHPEKDSLRVDLLNSISLKANRYDLNKTYAYGMEAKTIADSLDYIKGKAKGLRLIGEYYMRRAQPDADSSKLHLEASLKLFEEIDDKHGMGMTLRSLGTSYFFQNNYFKSLQYSHQSLKILEELGLKEEIANVLNNIGSLHSVQNNYEEALDYYSRSLLIFQAMDDKFKKAVCLYNMADLQLKTGDYHNALKNLQQSMVYLEELKLYTMIPSALNNLGSVNKLQRNYRQALAYYNEALGQSEKLGLKGTACDNLIGLAEVHFELKNYDQAEAFGIRGLTLADEMSILERQKQIHGILPKIYAAKGNFKKAYNYHKKFKAISDSVFNEENVKKLAGIEYQYEFYKEKQALLAEQQKKDALREEEARRQKIERNGLIYGFVLVLLLVLAIAYSLIQKQRANKKLRALNKSKDDIFSILAHDLRAPVGNIKAFIELILANQKNYNHQETMAIMARLGNQSASVFNILENLFAWANSQRQDIVLKKELQPINLAIEGNINLLKDSAKAKKISIKNTTDPSLVVSYDLTLISTVVRNLIANAIKFTHEEGKIEVASKNDNGSVVVSITDNGVGIEAEKVKYLFGSEVYATTLGTNSERGSGLGLKLSEEFVAKHQGKIWVESKKGEGSTFIFTLPK